MIIGDFVDKAVNLELEEVKDWVLEDMIKYLKTNKFERVYITNNLQPLFLFNHSVIIDIFLKNLLAIKVKEFVEENPNILSINYDRHIIETYNYMRKEKIEYAPVVKDNKLIGEISFTTLSLKISYIAIKDKLTHVYNEKYFNILIDEYSEIEDDIGIIMIKCENMEIFEGIYGIDFVNNALKQTANIIKNTIRDVDFLFRNGYIFKILTFNNAEITMKIRNRLENRLADLSVDDVNIPTQIVATHVPELNNNILLAVEELERKLIKRD